ncbi:MAG TPA: hypothetical protein VMM55_11860 [Thermohalobaculum sp.]|nr:hypothetical protein [Thermohalobaculum sp.]
MAVALEGLRRLAAESGRERADENLAFYLRLALATAILSVVFEKALEVEANLLTERYALVAATAAMVLSCGLVLLRRTMQIGLVLFTLSLLIYVVDKWAAYHNHGWLSVWTIPVALAFGKDGVRDELYGWYLRATLGIVMLAAAAQKVLAGTYLDGSFITFLSLYGTPTEQMFYLLCGPDAAEASCTWHRAVGIFIVVWQAAVGVLLLLGVRNLLFLFVEIGFLLGAGVYADEMNFQVLNIALLAIAFGYGMRPWLFVVCVTALFIDAYSIGAIVEHVL